MKLWFKFSKSDKMKYISYLDLLRVLSRGVIRAGLTPALSQGYNPQPKISFAHPLPLGVSVAKDYGEMELTETELDFTQITGKINEHLPSGFELLEIKSPIVEKPPKLMSLVDASAYEFDCSVLIGPEDLQNKLNKLTQVKEISITKWHKKKKKYVEKDLKPLIYYLKSTENGFKCIVQSGSRGNLRPDDLAAALFQDQNALHKIRCIRTEVYCLQGNIQIIDSLYPLWNWDEIDNNTET